MRIGELADEVGVNPKTIRYYESIGVLPEPDRTAGGYRASPRWSGLAVSSQRSSTTRSADGPRGATAI